MTSVNRRTVLSAGLGVALAATVGVATPASAAGPDPYPIPILGRTLFTQTNSPAGNVIHTVRYRPLGGLYAAESYPTGGTGTGAGLGSQGSVVVTPDERYLLAVNAGSDSVTAFPVTAGNKLGQASTAPSGGDQPVSVTASRGLVYVVNAGATPTISGFRLDHRGLRPIAGSTRALPGGAAGPAQISFTPDGRRLVVTLKATNRIDTFAVGADGRTAAAVSTPSAGTTPFGFDFDWDGNVLVSNASGGAAGASTVTSYRIGADGRLATVAGPISTGQSAACWLVVSHNLYADAPPWSSPRDPRAYVTNTASNTVTGLELERGGRFAVVNPSTPTRSAGPIDAAISNDNTYLYVLTNSGTIDVSTLTVLGNIKGFGSVRGLPAGLAGLAIAE
jgi:6-phosphogluconolactonase (cycloisomerase 2 family)